MCNLFEECVAPPLAGAELPLGTTAPQPHKISQKK